MTDDTEARKAAARATVAAGLQEYLVARLEELKEERPDDWDEIVDGSVPFITGWAVSMEYTNGWMERNKNTGQMAVVPADQSHALSVGLLTDASRKF